MPEPIANLAVYETTARGLELLDNLKQIQNVIWGIREAVR